MSITSVLKFVPSSLISLWPFDLRRSILQDISGDLDAMVSHNHAKSTHSPADFWRNEFREMQMDDPIPNRLVCFFLHNWYRPHSSGQWNMLTPCSTGNTCSKDSKDLFFPCYITIFDYEMYLISNYGNHCIRIKATSHLPRVCLISS